MKFIDNLKRFNLTVKRKNLNEDPHFRKYVFCLVFF